MAINPNRVLINNLFLKVCAKYDRWNSLNKETQETIVRRMERSCFSNCIDSCNKDGISKTFVEIKLVQRYSAICSRLLALLSLYENGKCHLLDNIIENKVNIVNIANISSDELCPDINKAIRDEILLRQNQKIINKVSRAYTCRKCGNNETLPIEFQGRASDELSTFSIKCVNCEFVWRK